MSLARGSLERVHTAVQSRLSVALGSRRTDIELLTARLHALDPEAILARGYAIARSTEGLVLGSATDFSDSSRFVLRLCDGEIEACVIRSSAVLDRDALPTP
jgi:exodeoxyribonuclease VII large subunit